MPPFLSLINFHWQNKTWAIVWIFLLGAVSTVLLWYEIESCSCSFFTVSGGFSSHHKSIRQSNSDRSAFFECHGLIIDVKIPSSLQLGSFLSQLPQSMSRLLIAILACLVQKQQDSGKYSPSSSRFYNKGLTKKAFPAAWCACGVSDSRVNLAMAPSWPWL